MIHKEVDGKDPIQVAKIIDDFANQFGHIKEAKELAKILTTDKTHRSIQTYIFEVFLECIRAWAKREKGYDDRNRFTHDRCVTILKALGEI